MTIDPVQEHLFASITEKQWHRIGVKPHHGINLPLFSLRSKQSCGIGEFLDLLPLIDWCHALTLDVIQLLPLNGSAHDPSPYNAASSCSLNFVYLSLHALPHLDTQPELKAKLEEFKTFNMSMRVQYGEVRAAKKEWLRTYFDAVGEKIISTPEYTSFLTENQWVENYALFKVIKKMTGNASWMDWPIELRSPTKEEYDSLIHAHHAEIDFYTFMQFLSFSQLKQVKEYASAHNIFLMGDIPILLSRESADVWQHPEFFDTHLAAGAPPDMYNPEGQYWGFPLFHWTAMRKTDYTWWKQRLHVAKRFFDLFRIDHVIGFFRLWAIPLNASSKEGHFVPIDETEWESQGRELLTMIATATDMLPIAEDLGTVPDIVRPILAEMGICGTKVMRWERKWKEDNTFISFHSYPPISLTCISTHDSETLTLWWKNFPEEAEGFARLKQWTYSPELTQEQRLEILWDSHHTSSLFHINLLQEYLALFPELVWEDSNMERVNIPGKVLPTNWTYRFRPTLEEITSHQGLLTAMQNILSFNR
jgi:4-alpha-glucanotransferase